MDGLEARPTVELKVSAEDEPELEAAAEPSRVPSYRLWYVAVIAALFVRPARLSLVRLRRLSHSIGLGPEARDYFPANC